MIIVRKASSQPRADSRLAMEPTPSYVAAISICYGTSHRRKRKMHIMTVIGIDEAL